MILSTELELWSGQPHPWTLILIENLWGDIRNTVSEAKPTNAEQLQMLLCHPEFDYLLTGVRSWSSPCNTTVKQLAETMAIKLNISDSQEC